MKHPYTFPLSALALLLLTQAAWAQDSPYLLRYTRTRKPAFDVSQYSVIAVGDITGPTGQPTPSSMNLTDDVTTRLVNDKSHEVMDHNALKQLYTSKSAGMVNVVNENIITALAKKTQSAILLTGRIQSDKVNQSLKTNTNSSSPTCPTLSWYESFGDFSVQIKAFDVKTAKLVYAEVIKIPMTHSTQKTCERAGRMDEEQIQREAAEAAAVRIAHMLLPYEENLRVALQKPPLSGAFKDLKNVAAFFNNGSHDQALQMLAKHTTDPEVKEKMKPFAFYNYGLALYVDGQFAKAKEQFLQAFQLNPTESAYKIWADNMDKEIIPTGLVKSTR